MFARPLPSRAYPQRSRQMEAGLLRARNDRRQRESIETKARKFFMTYQAFEKLRWKLWRLSSEDILNCCIRASVYEE
jgi:hypothetical protein